MWYSMGHLNVRSLLNSFLGVKHLILDGNYDIFLFIWNMTDDYDYYRGTRGGGVGLYIRSTISYTQVVTVKAIE